MISEAIKLMIKSLEELKEIGDWGTIDMQLAGKVSGMELDQMVALLSFTRDIAGRLPHYTSFANKASSQIVKRYGSEKAEIILDGIISPEYKF